MQNPDKTGVSQPDALRHPDPEEWMSYLYGELPAAARRPMKAHLAACPECREKVRGWRGAKDGLGHWDLAKATAQSVPVQFRARYRWAAAAVVLLGLGFGIGVAFASGAYRKALTAAVEEKTRDALQAQVQQWVRGQIQSDWQAALSGRPEQLNTDFRRQLRAGLEQWSLRTAAASSAESQRLVAEFSENDSATRERDQQAIATWLNQAEQTRRADYVDLRRLVETVAVVAADKFQRTDHQLGQLVSYTDLEKGK
jgi:hypothetical protein